MDDVSSQLDLLARSERRVAMATLVATRGTTPKKEGAKMWVGAGGRVLGSVTIGGCVDAKVIAESERVLESGAPQLISAVLVRPLGDPTGSRLVLESGESIGLQPPLDERGRAQALELLARGASRSQPLGEGGPEAFFEVHAPKHELVLIGAGHVSQALAELAKPLGFRVVIVDPRPRFASRRPTRSRSASPPRSPRASRSARAAPWSLPFTITRSKFPSCAHYWKRTSRISECSAIAGAARRCCRRCARPACAKSASPACRSPSASTSARSRRRRSRSACSRR